MAKAFVLGTRAADFVRDAMLDAEGPDVPTPDSVASVRHQTWVKPSSLVSPGLYAGNTGSMKSDGTYIVHGNCYVREANQKTLTVGNWTRANRIGNHSNGTPQYQAETVQIPQATQKPLLQYAVMGDPINGFYLPAWKHWEGIANLLVRYTGGLQIKGGINYGPLWSPQGTFFVPYQGQAGNWYLSSTSGIDLTTTISFPFSFTSGGSSSPFTFWYTSLSGSGNLQILTGNVIYQETDVSNPYAP